jgi:site-specific DNA-methyltransferase (adenine-specific)
MPPKVICTESYIVINVQETEQEITNVFSYIKTRFVRFLMSLVTSSQAINKQSFSLVPLQDFSKSWTDEELYAKYKLTDEEIAFIESMIKPME